MIHSTCTKELASLHSTFQCDGLKGPTMNFSTVEFCSLVFYVTFFYVCVDITCFGIIKRASFEIRDYGMAASKEIILNIVQYKHVSFPLPHLSEAATALEGATTSCNLIQPPLLPDCPPQKITLSPVPECQRGKFLATVSCLCTDMTQLCKSVLLVCP